MLKYLLWLLLVAMFVGFVWLLYTYPLIVIGWFILFGLVLSIFQKG